LENVNQPQRIFHVDISRGEVSPIVDGMDQAPPMPRGHVRQVEWRSRDERFVVHGFLVTPPRYDSTRRYPLIVMVHGGPGHLFTNDYARINFSPWHIPAQLLASAGYMVLLPNPRGDPSYGEE